jgi:hypothetical protein
VRHVVGGSRPDVALSSLPRVAPPPRARALRFGTSQGPPGCFPSAPPVLATPGFQVRPHAIRFEGPRLRIVTAGNNDPIGDGSARRASHARARRATSREAHPRGSYAARLVSSAGVDSRVEVVVRVAVVPGGICRRSSPTNARGRHAADAGVRAARRRPSRPARRDARRDVRRDRALVHATLARHSTPGRRRRRRRRSDGTTRCDSPRAFLATSDDEPSTIPRGGGRRPGDPATPAQLVFALTFP